MPTRTPESGLLCIRGIDVSQFVPDRIQAKTVLLGEGGRVVGHFGEVVVWLVILGRWSCGWSFWGGGRVVESGLGGLLCEGGEWNFEDPLGLGPDHDSLSDHPDFQE